MGRDGTGWVGYGPDRTGIWRLPDDVMIRLCTVPLLCYAIALLLYLSLPFSSDVIHLGDVSSNTREPDHEAASTCVLPYIVHIRVFFPEVRIPHGAIDV